MKDKIQIIAAAVSLAALLAYTLVHTGGLLARYIAPAFVGYIAAFGIELSIVSLSLRIGDMRKARQSDRFFTAVLVSVVAVSAVANVAEGFATLHGQPLTVATAGQLDPVQATIGILATGVISLIVVALSEITGNDVSAAIRKAEREARKAEQPAQVAQVAAPVVTQQDEQQDEQPAQVDANVPELPPAATSRQDARQVAGKLPRDWRQVEPAQRHELAHMTRDERAKLMPELSERAERDWHNRLDEIAAKNGTYLAG